MKLIKNTAVVLALLFVFAQGVLVFAEESSGDSVSEPEYDYTVSYGYRPLEYAGTPASDYVIGTTPATAYLKAGDNHKVSACYYSFRDYEFAGWSCNGKRYQPGEIIYNVNSNMKLIAEWKRPARPDMTVLGIISYAENGKVTETKSVELGTILTLKEGYWKDGYGRIFNGGSRFLLSFNIVDFVPAAKGSSTVSVKYDGGGVSDGIQSAFAVEAGGSFMVDGCYGVKEGYSFSGWSDGEGRVYLVGDTCVATKDTVLTAIWRENAKPAPNYCTVNLKVGEGGEGLPAGKSTVEKGKSFSFKINAIEGYKLISVVADGAELGTGGEYTLTVNADMSISASFEKLPEPPVINESKEEDSDTEADSGETEESSTEAESSESAGNTEDPDGKDDNGRRTVFIIIATVVCVGAIVLAGWFSAKSNKKRNKRRK